MSSPPRAKVFQIGFPFTIDQLPVYPHEAEFEVIPEGDQEVLPSGRENPESIRCVEPALSSGDEKVDIFEPGMKLSLPQPITVKSQVSLVVLDG